MIQPIYDYISNRQESKKVQYMILLAVTVLAAVLRFYKLGTWSLWIDEIFTVGRAQVHYGNLEAIVQNIPPSRNWIPLSLILTGGAFNLFGVSEWSARLVPAIIGICSIPLLYLPIRRLFGQGAGLIASLLLAFSPWHIYWSQNARFYTALLLLYTLALFSFFLALEEDRLRYVFLFIGFFYLAVSERLFALFVVPVLLSYLLLLWLLPFEKPKGFRWRNLLLMALPGFVAIAVEVYSLTTVGSSRFFADFDWFFLYRVDDPFRLLANISFNMGIPLMCLALFGGMLLVAQRSRIGLLTFVAAVVPVGLLIIANPFVFTKDRYAFVSLSSWVILAAVSVRDICLKTTPYSRLLAIGVLSILFSDAVGDDLLYFRVNNGNRLDWRGAFAFVEERSQEGDLFVAWWPQFSQYYLDQEIMRWEDIDRQFVEKSGKRVWFVLDQETVWGNPEMKFWVERFAELKEVKYLRRQDDYYLRIYLYDPSRSSTSGLSDIERRYAPLAAS